MTWELGRYEHIATHLMPAAEVAVNRLDPAPGEFVVDLGCGTGNAALLMADRGADVLGVDPTRRLLDIAEQSAEGRGLPVRFRLGEAAASRRRRFRGRRR